MTDTEKMYAYEMQRRQTIGNFLFRMSNLGYGNATGAGLTKTTDDDDQDLKNISNSLEEGASGNQDSGEEVVKTEDNTDDPGEPVTE